MAKPKAFIEEEAREAYEVARRFKQRDFSGNTGKVLKNSFWQISTTLIAKFGSLLFTIFIARLMGPEIYGLYGLALSTILFLGVFSDFGIGAALMTFISKNIDKRPGKAKGYFKYLTKYRLVLVVFFLLMLVALSSWIANSYYNKPIFYALLAGAIYLPITIFSIHFSSLFTSRNDFRPQFVKEVMIQISRLTIVPILIIYFLVNVTTEMYLFWIIIALSFCYGIGGLYYFIVAKMKHPFRETKAVKLNPRERVQLWSFILPLSVTALSGVFFGYIDQVMLGHYVESQFLGFYQAAFNLITSASAIISFGAAAVFPIFARLKSEKLERAFKKTRNITIMISIAAVISTYLIASIIISLVYGAAYSESILYLQILSLLLLSFPMINLYTTYYTSQERTKVMSILLIASTVLNIGLNYILINIGLQYSMSYAVVGACVATIISRYGYLFGLILYRRR